MDRGGARRRGDEGRAMPRQGGRHGRRGPSPVPQERREEKEPKGGVRKKKDKIKEREREKRARRKKQLKELAFDWSFTSQDFK